MALQSIVLRDAMLSHLRDTPWTTFEPGDVTDHKTIGQIWVRALAAPDRLCRIIFAYATGEHRIEFDDDSGPGTSEFYSELSSLASLWGQAVEANQV